MLKVAALAAFWGCLLGLSFVREGVMVVRRRLLLASLPIRHGYSFKLRILTRLGCKNPKFVTTLFVTNQQPRAFWPDRGYNWFSGI